LCPTMSSVMVTRWYVLPLCTSKRRPTKLGRMVAARAFVRTGGTLSPCALGHVMGRLWFGRAG
jgi:hypothetical protein